MNAFEFGYAVGSLEKLAAKEVPTIVAGKNPVNFRTVGNDLATVPGKGVRGAPVRDTVRQTIESGKRLGGRAMDSIKDVGGRVGGAIGNAARTAGGAAHTVATDVARGIPDFSSLAGLAGGVGILGAYGAEPGHRIEAAGRGVGYGVGAGTGIGLGQGLGKSVSRLLPKKYETAAQAAGAGLGGLAGVATAHKMMGPARSSQEAPAQSKKADVAQLGSQIGSRIGGAVGTLGSHIMNQGGRALGAAGNAIGNAGLGMATASNPAGGMLHKAREAVSNGLFNAGASMGAGGSALRNATNIARYAPAVGAAAAAGGAGLAGMAAYQGAKALSGQNQQQQPGQQPAQKPTMVGRAGQALSGLGTGLGGVAQNVNNTLFRRRPTAQTSVAPQAKTSSFAPTQPRSAQPTFFQQQAEKQRQQAQEQTNQTVRGGVGKMFGETGQQVYDKGVQTVGHIQNAMSRMPGMPRPTSSGNI